MRLFVCLSWVFILSKVVYHSPLTPLRGVATARDSRASGGRGPTRRDGGPHGRRPRPDPTRHVASGDSWQ